MIVLLPALILADRAESGLVYYKQDYYLGKGECDNTFFDEMNGFPNLRHDDRIDAVAKGIYLLGYRNNDFDLGTIDSHISTAYEKENF